MDEFFLLTRIKLPSGGGGGLYFNKKGHFDVSDFKIPWFLKAAFEVYYSAPRETLFILATLATVNINTHAPMGLG